MSLTPSLPGAGSSVGSSSVRNRPFRDEKAAEPTNFWRRMLKGKQRPDRKGPVTPNLPIAIDSIPPDTSVSPDPPESISLKPPHVPITLPPTTEKSATVSKPLPESSSTPELSAPKWSVRRDATANTPLTVTFVRSFGIQKGRVLSVKFSADGRYLAAALGGITGSVTMFDVVSGKKVGALAEYASQYSSEARPGSGFMCVRFSPNGRYLAIADMAARVMVWDIPKKRIRNMFSGHTSEVHSVDFSPNGRLVASACCDTTVRVWNLRDGSSKIFSDNASEFLSVRFSPNGQYVATANFDGILRVWDVRSGRLVMKWDDHDGSICSVAFTTDGKGLLTGSFGGALKIWDVSSLGAVPSWDKPVATKILKYSDQTGTIRSACNSPDTKWIASGSEGGAAIIWDTHTGSRQCTLLGYEGHVFSVDFSPAGTYLATGSADGYVTLWRYSST